MKLEEVELLLLLIPIPPYALELAPIAPELVSIIDFGALYALGEAARALALLLTAED